MRGAIIPEVPAATPSTSVLDEALIRLQRTGFEYGPGLSNHGPMACEALCALERPETVAPWLDRYVNRLAPRMSPREPLSPAGWRDALGRFERVEEWNTFFERELEEPWPAVLGRWVPRLAPGLGGAAAHGILRTAHAARSLSEASTPARLSELASGLAYWAARYQTLPVLDREVPVRFRPRAAIHHVALAPESAQGGGLISTRLSRLKAAVFGEVIDLADLSGEPGAVLSELTETFAHVFLANTPREVIALLHAVTGASAIRLLVPYLDREAAAGLLRYGWQVGAALYAAYAGAAEGRVPEAPTGESTADLVDRAVASGDEHAIKLTEVALREHAVSPKPVYLASARAALVALS